MSTFLWEYGVEAFAEKPSIQDLIFTPVVGSLLGEVSYNSINKIVSKDFEILGSKILGHGLIFLMDPLYHLVNFTGNNNNFYFNRNKTRFNSKKIRSFNISINI